MKPEGDENLCIVSYVSDVVISHMTIDDDG